MRLERRLSAATFWVAACLSLVVGVVLAVELRDFAGGLGGSLVLVLWNCLPVLVALWLVVVSRPYGRAIRFAGYGFAAAAAGFVLFEHIMWAYDVNKIATGSSTSGLLFLFLPAWAVIFGAVAAVPAGLIGFALGPRVR
jgi:hypothetical protein